MTITRSTFKNSLLCLSLITVSLLFSSCSKDSSSTCPEVNKTVPQNELTQLDNYISASNIIAERDARGFYYAINNNGNSNKPNACANILVNYVGKLVSGQVFDQNQNASFSLKGLITGWQMAMPLVGEEGEIIIYLPPTLGYGITGNGAVPSNAITIFTITLIKVNN